MKQLTQRKEKTGYKVKVSNKARDELLLVLIKETAMFVHMLVSVYNTNNNTASYTVVGCRGTTVCVYHVGATLRSGDRNHYYHLVLFVFCFLFFLFSTQGGAMFLWKTVERRQRAKLSIIYYLGRQSAIRQLLRTREIQDGNKAKLLQLKSSYRYRQSSQKESFRIQQISRYYDLFHPASLHLNPSNPSSQTSMIDNKPVEVMATQLEHV